MDSYKVKFINTVNENDKNPEIKNQLFFRKSINKIFRI